MQFPVVGGTNLLRQRQTLPADLEGDQNIVLIAFERWQQEAIDTWIPFARELERSFPELRYYELPTIQQLNLLARTFINEGMRAGIPDPIARERTITLYVDKMAFRRALDLPSEDRIYVLLLDRQGEVLWRTEGSFAPEKGESLTAVVRRAKQHENQ